jgi:hypothetical protein
MDRLDRIYWLAPSHAQLCVQQPPTRYTSGRLSVCASQAARHANSRPCLYAFLIVSSLSRCCAAASTSQRRHAAHGSEIGEAEAARARLELAGILSVSLLFHFHSLAHTEKKNTTATRSSSHGGWQQWAGPTLAVRTKGNLAASSFWNVSRRSATCLSTSPVARANAR